MKVRKHPPSASRVQLPDGRFMAYHEQGVSSETARFSLVAPHSFLSSRLAGKLSLNFSYWKSLLGAIFMWSN